MRTLTSGLALLLLVALAAAGCSRHSAQTAQKATHRPTDAAVIAVKPNAAPAASGERPTAMTEESEGTAEVAAGLSPIAAAVAANTPAAAAPIPARWIEGKHYSALVPTQPTSVAPDRVEVVEVFWYGCGHCFHLEPTIEDWRKTKKPAYVEFSRLPVIWNEITRAHARLFFTIEALGKREELHPLVFHEIHVNGNVLADADPEKTEAMQRDFLLAHGVTAAEFTNVYRSLDVAARLRRAEDLKRRYGATSVPLMVVNAKYTTDIGMAGGGKEGGETDLMQLVNDLAASEHRR
jgi:protein dithiol oxidoreductase (disulfide-forming)